MAEQPAECLEPIDQTLGIVEPIDADGERSISQAFAQPHRLDAMLGAGGGGGEAGGIDADRIDDGQHMSAFAREAVVTDLGAGQDLPRAVQKGTLIGSRVKTHNVECAHGTQQFRRARQCVQQRRRDERRVQEKADAVARPEPTQFFGQREQVVVMYPDQVVVP